MKIAPSSCLLSVVAAICLAAGCATQHGGNTRTYVAHAMMIEGPTSEFERIGWNDVTNNMKPSFTAAISDSVFQSLKLKVVHFPLLALRLGQTTDASNQQIVRYATSLDTNGMPGVFKEQGVGQKMQIRLVEATGARVSVDAWLENVREPKWQNVTEGMNGASECKIPFFASRSWFPKWNSQSIVGVSWAAEQTTRT